MGGTHGEKHYTLVLFPLVWTHKALSLNSIDKKRKENKRNFSFHLYKLLQHQAKIRLYGQTKKLSKFLINIKRLIIKRLAKKKLIKIYQK